MRWNGGREGYDTRWAVAVLWFVEVIRESAWGGILWKVERWNRWGGDWHVEGWCIHECGVVEVRWEVLRGWEDRRGFSGASRLQGRGHAIAARSFPKIVE